MNFARYRSDLWKEAAMWFVRKSGEGQGAKDVMEAQYEASPEDFFHFTSPSSMAPPPSPCFLPQHYTVLVLPHPTLSVLVDGRPVRDLVSSFSDASGESEQAGESEATVHRFWLRRMTEAEAAACAPKDEDEWNPLPADDDPTRPTPIRSAPADDCFEVELRVWIDTNPASASAPEAGQVQSPSRSAVVRDKKHARFRYALHVDGRLMRQAVSPLHDSRAQPDEGDKQSGPSSANSQSPSGQPSATAAPPTPSDPTPSAESLLRNDVVLAAQRSVLSELGS